MNIKELIKTRRSVKSFKDTPIGHDVIRELLDTAVWAPNHKMTQPWRFIVLQGEAKNKFAQLRREVAYNKMKDAVETVRTEQANRVYETISKVPTILFAIITTNEDPTIAQEDYVSCACVVENFMLLAWEKGIGTAWKTFVDTPAIREFLGIREDERVVSTVYIGYPEVIPPARVRVPLHDRITFRT